ncbi:MAG: isoprenylcysteine carboxylmethyltransferase family protein [Mesorhizobium sp.]|nr:MAG: isoprenylcysteine carboxylmethyltransferase family protein [Mesorhizobium sp.]TIS89808.1 MAG: isoprenylcysteine carboxylmethyltransferase family protein [Mesorhizobium sp.]
MPGPPTGLRSVLAEPGGHNTKRQKQRSIDTSYGPYFVNAALFAPRIRIALSRSLAALLLGTLALTREGWEMTRPMFEHSLSLIGWVCIAVAVAGRLWCGLHIGGRKNTELAVIGPYSVCRNPLYFFSFVGGLGVMLVTETLLLPLVFCILFAVYYSKVIASEEETLLKLHGAAFREYCSRVPRFWPQIRLFIEPDSYLVSAAPVRKSLADGTWFIIAGGLVEFLEGLHNSGFLPTFVHIY